MVLALPAVLSLVLCASPDGAAAPSANPPAAKPADALDDAVYAAVKAETQQRDFEAAVKLWSAALDLAENAKRAEVATKANLGIARCQIALGRREEARTRLKQLLAADAKNAEASALLAKLNDSGNSDRELEEAIRQRVARAMGGGTVTEEARREAEDDVRRMGDAAVPVLAANLNDLDVAVVARAAAILASLDTPKATDALTDAYRTGRCHFPQQLLNAAGDASSTHGPATIAPFFLALLDLPDPKLHELAASFLRDHAEGCEAATIVPMALRLVADPDPHLRDMAAWTRYGNDAARRLRSTFEPLFDSGKAESIQLASYFMRINAAAFPPEDVARWSKRFRVTSSGPIRIAWWSFELERVRNDGVARAEYLLEMLSDSDPDVVTYAGSQLKANELPSAAVPMSIHARLHEIVAHVLSIAGLDAPSRLTILSVLPLSALTDEERFDLYVLAADHPAEADPSWRAIARGKILNAYRMSRASSFTPSALEFFAFCIRRIPDVEGRRSWFRDWAIYFPGGSGDANRYLAAAAVSDSDAELRAMGYSYAADHSIWLGSAPHLQEDLATDDPVRLTNILKVAAGPAGPSLLPRLREIVAKSSDPLRQRTLETIARIGGEDAAQILIEEFHRDPKAFSMDWLGYLERAIGPERLAAEIVGAPADSMSPSWLAEALQQQNALRHVSGSCAENVLRSLPAERVTPSLFNAVAAVLPPVLLRQWVNRFLSNDDPATLLTIIPLVGRLHVDSAWDRLVGLLDTADGQVRNAAVEALKSLRDYRELKRSVVADDSDARREAFEKAKAMAAGKNADQKVAAAIALAAIGDVRAIPVLLDLSGDEKREVRDAARSALEKMAERAAAPGKGPDPAPASVPSKSEGK